METDKLSPNGIYSALGGIEEAFSKYKTGELTLKQIGKTIGYTHTAVSLHMSKYFSKDAYNQVQIDKKKRAKINTIISRIISGARTTIDYAKHYPSLIKQTPNGETIINETDVLVGLTKPLTGDISSLTFSQGKLKKVSGENGTVAVRHATANSSSLEHKTYRHRFKIGPQITKHISMIFCIVSDEQTIYYTLPSDIIKNLRSLNLKFANHEHFTYSKYISKVECSHGA